MKNKWVKTDDMQYLRKIGPRHYELIEAVAVDGKWMVCEAGEVRTDPEGGYQDSTTAVVNSYYSGGVEEFNRLVPDPEAREQYLAEMLYESGSVLLSREDYGEMTEGEAEHVLLYYTETGEYPDIEKIRERMRFEQKCYEAYQLDWMVSHGHSLNDLYHIMVGNMGEQINEEPAEAIPEDSNSLWNLAEYAKEEFLFSQGFGNGGVFACKGEFLGAEFQDRAYMEHLISLMPNPKEMEAFWRKEYGIWTYEPKISIPTSAGVLKAYESADPAQPGICVCMTPAGTENEIDLSYVSVYEDPGIATEMGERPVDVVILTYADPYSEDYTTKDILRREDVVKAME